MSDSDKRSLDQFIIEHWSELDQAKRYDIMSQHRNDVDVDTNAPMEQLNTFSDFCAELRG